MASSFIRKIKTGSGATAVQVVYKRGREVTSICHIGSAHSDAELEILLSLAHKIKLQGQLSLFEEKSPEIYLERTYSQLLVDALASVYDALGFDILDDEIFKYLVLARIIEPASKLDTIRILDELGIDAPSYSSVARCLLRVVKRDYRSSLSKQCFAYVSPDSLSLILYDVTTLYFEAQKEDGYRVPGLSKERRLDPQIKIGLLVDSSGFPLEVMSFEGNCAEVKTIIPVLENFKARYQLKNITVTADAAMLSAANIGELEKLGFNYIIASRLAKTPYEIVEYINETGAVLDDLQIFESSITVTIDSKRRKRRVIYQYRAKRAALDLANIEKTLDKAKKIVQGQASMRRNRFLKLSGAKKEINYDLLEEAKKKAGIKGYVTNLDVGAQYVIDAYHQLFEVEKSFRMSKSDLEARPIFHHKRSSIEAHLTIVFAALAIARFIEGKTGISIRKFLHKLKPLKTGVILVGGTEIELKPRMPTEVSELLDLLGTMKCGY